MTNRTTFARIAITLPAADLAAADRLAKQQDRSRSWIVAEAIRRYADTVTDGVIQRDLGDARRAQLRRDLALTAEERVREAEETQRLAERVTAPTAFSSFDDFLAWQRSNETIA
ncbi:MAG: ribbon-helix-helix protein, CopG family [Gemmatimonas sp.]